MNTLALCIPAYNAEKHLPRLLSSAKKQSIPFDEILVYNDCSLDETVHTAERYGAMIINGDINRGCSYGKNQLASATTCEWIHFHDADDDLLPDFTKKIHQWINTYGQAHDVLLLNFDYVDFSSGQLLGKADHHAEELKKDPLRYAILNKIVNFGVYKRSSFLAARGFDLDEKVLYNEDNAFHQRLAKAGLKFDYLPEITCINFRYQASMSASNRLKCAQANFHVLAKTAMTHGNIYPAELARQVWLCIASLAASQDWKYVKKALSLTAELGHPAPPEGDKYFRRLAGLHPFFAVWIREKTIRIFKSHLRNGS